MDSGIWFLLVAMSFINGGLVGSVLGYLQAMKQRNPPCPPVTDTLDEKTIDIAEREREQFLADNRAFKAMLDYNTSIAYGLAAEDER